MTAGANPISVKKGIDKTCDFLVEKLREKAQPVKGSSDIKVRCCRSRCTGACFAAWRRQAEGVYVLACVARRMRPSEGACGPERRCEPAQADLCVWQTQVGDQVLCSSSLGF